MMKKLSGLFLIAVAASSMLGTVANAELMSGDIIQLANRPGGPGGLFELTEPGDADTSFLTFCAHVYEDLDFDTDYQVVISETTDPGNLPVGPLAAWLYTQFLDQSSALVSFDYDLVDASDNSNPTANKQARALQYGIWSGMGFSDEEISTQAGWSSSFIQELKDDYFDAWLGNYNATGWQGTGQIKILRLYGQDRFGDYTVNVQDQLYRVPEPSALLLAGSLATAAFGLVRRRNRQG